LFKSGNNPELFQNNKKINVRFTAKVINPAAIICLQIIAWGLAREKGKVEVCLRMTSFPVWGEGVQG
jgi:hypothetical protein